MKLVVCFSTGNEVWNADHTFPVEYESAEQLLVDYEAEVLRATKAYTAGDWRAGQIQFLGFAWDLSDFYDRISNLILEISIFTLEEWFEQNKVS